MSKHHLINSDTDALANIRLILFIIIIIKLVPFLTFKMSIWDFGKNDK